MANKILTAAMLLVGSAGAWAQSSVTMGGVVDAALRSVKNDGGASVRSLVSGQNSTSRIYFRGSEDLGAGLGASFWLESGIALDSGANASSTQFFDRRSTLSLTGKRWGEIRLGRDYVPSYTVWSRHDPFSHLGVAGSTHLTSAAQSGPIRAAFGSSANTTLRSNNFVQYFLPSGLGGLEGGLMFAPSENGGAAQQRVAAGRLGWQSKAFGIHAGYTQTRNDLNAGNPFKDGSIGVNGTFGGVRLNLALRRYEFAQAKQTNAMVSAFTSFGPVDVKATYVRADMSGQVGAASIDANDAHLIGIGAVYNLSKRTALYAQASRLSNDGNATFVIPGGQALTAGGRSSGVEAGLRHSF